MVVDPTAEEEDLASGTLTIVTIEDDKLCSVHKPGINTKLLRINISQIF